MRLWHFVSKPNAGFLNVYTRTEIGGTYTNLFGTSTQTLGWQRQDIAIPTSNNLQVSVKKKYLLEVFQKKI